ncbi:helix-turn-helix transcriptional regulator [Pseudomonas oryzihabitans]|uniref:helix-turn-helix transcriptional regulator n=1 Tax=Pseudomonas oryzihabitans TaxID=47885 RepID=UPI0005E6ECDB|nr:MULTISPECIES: AraC family transcriptional regulator [Pseudomonas]KIZ52459.1 AraC family transcriptional regulator [Pseudomonas oryzihabitans]MBA1258125.1 AraC family transcriptional regulator [Pseudomonas psychrotolerans]MBH3329195.1 helix-turn-helix domain-containing protein [Pseudomonas oryzihabitans]MCI1009683.1 helix-turn-helix transcriptional regulator [Pseudomonas oryzihabitans]HJE67171.1 AraC family transcriptional regulator [Pseudomonas oryzihabitans]
MQEQTIDPTRSVVADAPVPPAGPLVSQLGTFAHGQVWPPHVHDQAHLMYTVNGVLEVTTHEGVWYVPPKQAIWIPPRIEHQARANGEATLQVVIIALPSGLPCPQAATRMVLISPLLRELLRCLRRGGAAYGEAELGSHVRALMLAELVFLEETALHLPALADRRLRTIQTSLHADPADDTALATWAQQLHLCSRSLARLFLKETGTSFSTWRQHTRLMLALPRLAAGEPVTRVALDLGYASPSAFTRMFRRVLGVSPSEYLDAQG